SANDKTDSSHRLNQVGRPELLSEVVDIHVDDVRIAVKGVAPDFLEDLVARQHSTSIGQQQREQVEFARGQLHCRAVALGLAALAVEHHAAIAEQWLL